MIESAARFVTSEGYSLAAAADVVNASYPTLRQWCQKHADKNAPAADWLKLKVLKEDYRQFHRQLRQASREREILKIVTTYFVMESH
jgi:transposase-like protein